MLSFCLKCSNNNENLWNCTLPESKKLKFIKEQEASGLLSSLGIRESLSKIPLLRLLLF